MLSDTNVGRVRTRPFALGLLDKKRFGDRHLVITCVNCTIGRGSHVARTEAFIEKWRKGCKSEVFLLPENVADEDPRSRIHILVDGNPKSGAPARRFVLYRNEMTLADYVSEIRRRKLGTEGVALADLAWDQNHMFIRWDKPASEPPVEVTSHAPPLHNEEGTDSTSPRNPAWTRDELILALDLYVRSGGHPPAKEGAEISELSRILNRLSGAFGRATDFRNNNGIYMKLMNFRRFDPLFQAQGKIGLSRGNKLEEAIWNEFASDPSRLAQTANAIRANLSEPNEPNLEPIEIDEAEEGRVLTRAHLVRECSRKLVDAKKNEALQTAGRLACEACGFDFKETYGDRGDGFIEAHHAVPLHELLPGTKTRLADLHLLCANCHRMVHSRRPWLTIDQLRHCLRTSAAVTA